MTYNPFDGSVRYENNLEDFGLPYALQSKTDKEVMQRRYQELVKSTHGPIVRLGIRKY
jgi:hypothetical protein